MSRSSDLVSLAAISYSSPMSGSSPETFGVFGVSGSNPLASERPESDSKAGKVNFGGRDTRLSRLSIPVGVLPSSLFTPSLPDEQSLSEDIGMLMCEPIGVLDLLSLQAVMSEESSMSFMENDVTWSARAATMVEL